MSNIPKLLFDCFIPRTLCQVLNRNMILKYMRSDNRYSLLLKQWFWIVGKDFSFLIFIFIITDFCRLSKLYLVRPGIPNFHVILFFFSPWLYYYFQIVLQLLKDTLITRSNRLKNVSIDILRTFLGIDLSQVNRKCTRMVTGQINSLDSFFTTLYLVIYIQ